MGLFKGLGQVVLGVVGFFVVMVLIVNFSVKHFDFSGDEGSSPDPELSRQMDAAVAFGACARAIKAASKNPSSAEIPDRTNLAESGGFMFDWRRGDGLRLMNGFGAKLDTTATCVVSDDGRTVRGLVIDGKKVIYNK